MTIKCKNCNFKADASEFKQVTILHGGGMDYACPKCYSMGIITGDLVFVVDVTTRKIDVGDLIKRMRKDFGIKK